MRKILSIILSLLMISSVFTGVAITVNASEKSDSEVSSSELDFNYDINEEGDAVIRSYNGTDDIVSIPENINGYMVTEIAPYAFSGNNIIRHIEIPQTMRVIGESAFYNCESLRSVAINHHAEIFEILDATFANCISLEFVSLPDNLNVIGKNAFYNCMCLTDIQLPERLTLILPEAFWGCRELKSILIPMWTSIEYDAFGELNPDFIMYGYTHSQAYYYAREHEIFFICVDAPAEETYFTYEVLGSDDVTITGYTGEDMDVVIPEKIGDYRVVAIGERAFYDSQITSVELPASLREIRTNAFENCKNLTEINIPAEVMYIDTYAFRDCTSLSYFTVDPVNYEFSSADGILYNKDGSVLISCPMNWQNDQLDIPDTVKEIYSNAFENCIRITDINFGEGIEKIGSSAFSGCYALTEIIIPDSVTEIGDYAFANCESATNISIPNTISVLPKFVFEDCKSLTSIEIPDSITKIDTAAFLGCENLQSIEIPDSVTEIKNLVFQHCSSLTDIKLSDKLKALGSHAFYCCDKLETVEIPSTITKIDSGVFRRCKNLTEVILPDTIQSIGSFAFRECTSLRSITIPKETTIVDDAFMNANPELVMYGYTNSPAQTYAEEKGFTFIPLDVVKGDLSGDGVVDINDVTDIQKILVGDSQLTNEQLYAADVDGDGIVCVRDATHVQKYLAGIIDTL